jgi:hypothetical protein
VKLPTAAGLAFFLLAACSPSPETSDQRSATPLATATGTEQPTPHEEPTGASGWLEVGSFGAPNTIERVTAMTFGVGQFVAIGHRWATATGPLDDLPTPDGGVWLSPDGRTWEALGSPSVFANSRLHSLVTAADGSLLAFGTLDANETGIPGSAVWRSLDGRSWDRVEVGLPSDLRVARVVHGAQGYLLDDGQRMWFSPDAFEWGAVDEVRPFGDIGAGDEGFVALFEAGGGDAHITIASADGREWFMGEALPGYGLVAPLGPDWISSVVPGVVAFPVDLEIWSSANGLDWTQVATISDPQERDSFGYVYELVSAGGLMVLTVNLSVCCGVAVPAGVWSSEDGIAWGQLDLDPESLVTTAAAHDGTVVLAGYVGADQGRATFWVEWSP